MKHLVKVLFTSMIVEIEFALVPNLASGMLTYVILTLDHVPILKRKSILP